jgi:hypothetical protein
MSERTKEQVVAELDAKIPRDVISKREGGNGRSLSYLEGHYVIDRLNKVLGQGNWSYDTEEMRLVHSGTIQDKYGKDTHTVHYVSKIRLTVHSFQTPSGQPLSFSDFGYGDGSDKQNIGKAHELAVKEAVTDGVKRCAKNLGMSMGLALYDKTQENVEDEPKPESKPAPQLRAVESGKPAAQAPAPKAAETVARPPVQEKAAGSDSGISEAPPADRKQLDFMVSSMSKTYIAKRRGTKDTLVSLMKEKYGVITKEELTDEQAKEFYGILRGMIS